MRTSARAGRRGRRGRGGDADRTGTDDAAEPAGLASDGGGVRGDGPAALAALSAVAIELALS